VLPPGPCLPQAVLLGYYTIPEATSGIQLALNPAGKAARVEPRVWNAGDGRCKLLLLVPLPTAQQALGQQAQQADAPEQAHKRALPAAGPVPAQHAVQPAAVLPATAANARSIVQGENALTM